MSGQVDEQIEDSFARKPKISVKCRGKSLFEIIPMLNDAQILAARRIEFGGMLELKFKHFPFEHTSLFMDCFNDGSYVFRAPKSKHFMVSKHDVHDRFLLPYGPDELVLVPTGSQKGSDSAENVELKTRWREMFGISSSSAAIPIGKLKAAILEDQEGGDHFCRLFVLLCMSSFLAPTVYGGVDLKLLRAVEDVSAIPRLDWCSYVLQAIVGAGEDIKLKQSSLVGCIPFLMITYFQRFDFRGQICPHDLPLIKHWDEARLKSRIKGEVADGGLGRQTWSMIKYPRCILAPRNNHVNVIGDRQLHNSSPKQVDITSTSTSMSVKKFIEIELLEGVEDDKQLKDRALDAVHELYLKVQRNSVAFHAWYVGAISSIKHAMEGSIDSVGIVPSQSTQDFWQCEELHRYCDLVEYNAQQMKEFVANAPVVGEVRTATRGSKDEHDVATVQLSEVLCDIKKDGTVDAFVEEHPFDDAAVCLGNDVSQPSNEPVSSDQVIDSEVFFSTDEINEVMLRIKKGKHASSVEGSTSMSMDESDRALLEGAGYTPDKVTRALLMEKKKGKGVIDVGDGRISPVSVYVPHTDLIHHPFLLHSPHVLPCMGVVPENLGCSFDCGSPDPRKVVVSDFLSSRKNLFCTVFSVRKDVMDYVFSSPVSVDMLEQLVLYTDCYFIPREDIFSLLPGNQVTNNIIECWCMLLNHMMNSNTASVASSRCFFGLSHASPAMEMWYAKKCGKDKDLTSELFTAWDMWIESCFPPFHLEADMVFIPVLSKNNDHYSCACINFISEQIEYLDNRSYDDDPDKLPYTGIARIVADAMGKYMVSKGVEKGLKVSGFKLVNVAFRWQGVGYNNGDCGVYMMLHMLFYCGSPFECGLGEMDCNDLYRAEVAAILILSNINKCREDVLSRVASFTEVKNKPRRMISSYKTPPQKTKTDPKRMLEIEVDCEVTYKRRRSSTPTAVSCPSVEPLSVLSSHRRGKGDGLGCSLDCRPVSGLSTLVVSNFLRNNQTLCKNVKDLRKHVADYGFLDDNGMPNVEVLARYGRDASIRRDDILSMLPDVLMSSFVIECWAMLLNKIESDGFQPARMAFFGLCQTDVLMRLMDTPTQCTPGDHMYDMLYKHWDIFIKDCGNTINLEANLIFIPIQTNDHIACACINFNSKIVDILDNQSHPDPTNSVIFKAPSILASAMSDYLDSKGVTKGTDIPSFEHCQIMFEWVRPPALNEESGIFTMVHMLMYEGHTFKHSDLDNKKNRRYLIVQLAATLVLADVNCERDEVLEKINLWVSKKTIIWADIQARRRIAKLITKSSK